MKLTTLPKISIYTSIILTKFLPGKSCGVNRLGLGLCPLPTPWIGLPLFCLKNWIFLPLMKWNGKNVFTHFKFSLKNTISSAYNWLGWFHRGHFCKFLLYGFVLSPLTPLGHIGKASVILQDLARFISPILD